jgi:transcriptional regulator with XRE-family HTH domain
MQTFGEFLREIRKSHNLTLTQMAAKLEIDSANLSKIENGKRDLDERKLQPLAELFDLNFNELKTEYYGEKFAKKMYEVNCSDNTLIVAEQKVKYFRQRNNKQGRLKF